MSISVALDGPSGAGKSTIAKRAADRLGFLYADTGALYRAIAYKAVSEGFDAGTPEGRAELLSGLDVKLSHSDGVQSVWVNGCDVSDKIRTPEVSAVASDISKYPEVRAYLLDLQRDIAKNNDIIMDGRDIGTVVLPDASIKIFLTASPEIRARRRFEELSAKGDGISYEEVLKAVVQRDYNDSHRDIAPLKQAEDAMLIDSSEMTADEVTQKLVEAVGSYKKKSEKPVKKKRTPREIMPVNPIKKGVKINPVRLAFYTLVRYIVRFLFWLWFDLSFEGVENVPKDGGNIFASNHRSYADPVFIALRAFTPISYMAKQVLFEQNIFFALLIRMWGAFPVKGDGSEINVALEKLNGGRNLVIFPEGTRSFDGKVKKGKTGVALVAAVAQTRIIPVGISFEGRKLAFRKKVVVRYGKPIYPGELGIDNTTSASLKKLKNRIMDDITNLVY